MISRISNLVFAVFTAASCTKTSEITGAKPQVIVFAAASTTQVVSDIAREFERNTGISVAFNFASSGILARQIEMGAHTDLFISASEEWIQHLEDKGLLECAKKQTIMKNQLVMVVPATNTKLQKGRIPLLSEVKGRIAMGDPAHVPAGKFATQALTSLGIFSKWSDRILPSQNVSAALRAVEMEECEVGIVYRTDALSSPKVREIYQFSEFSHSPIEIVMTAMKKHAPSADRLYKFFQSNEAQKIIQKHGFSIPK